MCKLHYQRYRAIIRYLHYATLMHEIPDIFPYIHTYILTYLLTYLLHGAESFLRS